MDKLLLLFGLMRKAGRVEIGDEPATDALRRGEAIAVCCAADASENTIKHFRRAAEGECIPFVPLRFDKKELGGVFGRESVAVAALTDVGFGARLFEICAEDDPQWKDTAEKYRRRADDLVEEQKRRRKEEKEARKGKRPKHILPDPVIYRGNLEEVPKAAPKPSFGSHDNGYHGKSEGYRGKNGEPRFEGKRREPDRRSDRRPDYVSEENPTGKTYGKVYGKAPKSEHVSIGDRRREDAQRQKERYGASENGSRFEKKSFAPRSDGDKPFRKKSFAGKSFDKKPYGERSEKSFDKRSFDKKPYGEKSFDRKPYGKKSEYPRKRSAAPYENKRNGSADNQGKPSRSAQHYADSSVKTRNGGKA